MNQVNQWYDEATVFSVPPFAALPWAHKGGIIGNGEQTGHGKLQAAEHKRLATVLPHIVDALTGGVDSIATIAYGRCDNRDGLAV